MNSFVLHQGQFPKREDEQHHHMLLQDAFRNRANTCASGSVETLRFTRSTLGLSMFQCKKNHDEKILGRFLSQDSWVPFEREYYHARETCRAVSDVAERRIKDWFLSGRHGFRFTCPHHLQSELANPIMIILICMTHRQNDMRPVWDRYEGCYFGIRDNGSLLHLAIYLDAPARIVRRLIEDSCGLALNVRGEPNMWCERCNSRVPPLGLVDWNRAKKMRYDVLETLLFLGIKYMWCLPFFYEHSVWRIVKCIARYPHPVYRSTAHILMDFGFRYDPVIIHAIGYDREVRTSSENQYLAAACSSFVGDQAGTGCTLIERIKQLVDRDNLTIDPIYSLVRDDPMGCVKLFLGEHDKLDADRASLNFHYAQPAYQRFVGGGRSDDGQSSSNDDEDEDDENESTGTSLIK